MVHKTVITLLVLLMASAATYGVTDVYVTADSGSMNVDGLGGVALITAVIGTDTCWQGYVTTTTAPVSNRKCLVLAFQLPALPAGQKVVDANFNAYVAGVRSISGTPVGYDQDLYGIPEVRVGATPPIFGTDFYTGVKSSRDYPIAYSFVVPANTLHYVSLTDAGNNNLRCLIQTLYDKGAVAGDWLLLRWNAQSTGAGSSYYNYIAPNNAVIEEQRPRVRITFGPEDPGLPACPPTTIAPFISVNQISKSGLINTTAAPAQWGWGETTDPVTLLGEACVQVSIFQIPTNIPANKKVTKANFSSMYSNFYGYGFNSDLYVGSETRFTPVPLASDYSVGYFGRVAGDTPEPNGIPIMADYITSTTEVWTYANKIFDTDLNGQLRLAKFINDAIAAGKAGQYFTVRCASRCEQYASFQRTQTDLQKFTYELGDALPPLAPAIVPQIACCSIDKPSGDSTGDCEVYLDDLAALASGWLSCNAVPVDYCGYANVFALD